MNDFETRLRQSFHRNLDPVQPSPLQPERLRGLRRAGVAVTWVAVVMALLIVAGATLFTVSLLGGRQKASPSNTSRHETSDVAIIECREDGAHVLTPRVRAFEGGVRIRIRNLTDKREFFMQATRGSDHNQGGRLKRHGVTRITSSAPPGDKVIGCFDSLEQIDYEDVSDSAYGRFTIVDPEGLWVSAELVCVEGEQKPRIGTDVPADEEPRYEKVAREYVSGLEPDDVLERPFYPESELHFETRMVVRGGRRIAAIMFDPGRKRWGVFVRVCAGSGIGHSQP